MALSILQLVKPLTELHPITRALTEANEIRLSTAMAPILLLVFSTDQAHMNGEKDAQLEKIQRHHTTCPLCSRLFHRTRSSGTRPEVRFLFKRKAMYACVHVYMYNINIKSGAFRRA